MKGDESRVATRRRGGWLGRLFAGITGWFSAYGRKLVRGLENYLKSKTKNFPVSPPKPRRRVIELLEKDPIFLEAVSQVARETGFSREEVAGKGKSYLKEIASDLNYLTGPFWDLLLSWVFNKLYEGVSVDEAALTRLEDKVGKLPIVFVPNHRSHVDYLLLSYILYTHRLPLPYVCAGNNMNFWPVGGLFRRSGAFFIRRSFEGNRLYQAALYTYLHYLLAEKGLLEFFIEGTRSRTGKLLPPRLGILQLLVKAYQAGDIPDIAFVPSSLVYESIIEEKNYLDEQAGGKKSRESLWDLFRLRKYLRSQHGKVYLRFDEPIFLKEFAADHGGDEASDLVPRLASQISYAINRRTVVTPTSLVAMSLLAHPRPILTAEEVVERYDRYLEYLRRKEAPLSDLVAAHPHESLQQALRKYTHSRMICRYQDEEGVFYEILPPERKVLEYYKNTGIHFFISAAAVASVILTARRYPIESAELETEIAFLQELFQNEFSFSRRKPLSEHIQAVLTFFEKKEAITSGFQASYRPGPRAVWLEEFRSLLAGPLAAYWGILKGLTKLPVRHYEEENLIRLLMARSRLQLLRKNFIQQEALSPFLVKNALRAFAEMNWIVLKREVIGKKTRTFYQLPADPERTKDPLKHLEHYVRRD